MKEELEKFIAMSNYAGERYEDVRRRANLPRGSKIPLHIQEEEVRGIGMVDQRPDVVISTKMGKTVASEMQRAANAGVAPPPMERIFIA